jgi:hypothetical protein
LRHLGGGVWTGKNDRGICRLVVSRRRETVQSMAEKNKR